MSHSVPMPALGESVTEGTVTRWLKSEGDQVTEDEPLLEVSTDKVDTEVPAPYSGILEKILVQEDETVDIGADLALIGDGSGAGEASGAPNAADSAPPAAEQPAEPVPAAEPEPAAAPKPVEAAPEPAAAGAAAEQPSAQPATGTEVTMPAMGESVTEGTVTQWLKKIGDEIAVDEPIVEIATDKVDAEVPSPIAGTLVEIRANEDDTVEVGAVIAIIGEVGANAAPTPDEPTTPAANEPAAAQAPTPPAPAAQPEPTAPPSPAPTPAAAQPTAAPQLSAATARPSASSSRPGGYVTPVVRKLAADNGVDLASVQGSGVGGRIRREDVLAAASAPAQTNPPAALTTLATPTSTAPVASGPVTPDASATALVGTTQPAARIRQSNARNMLDAVNTSAQSTVVVEVDATRVAALRDRAQQTFEAREGHALSFLPFFTKAAVEAAKAHPIVNASLSENLAEITYHPTVNMGLEVDTPRGTITPVLHQADDLSLTGLARRISDLAQRTRQGAITPNELSGATLTISNAGSVGALFDTAIFVPPQSALLTVGAVVKRPVVVTDSEAGDVIAVRSMAYAALSYDHRTIDGADAARYLATVKRRIEDGDFEADLGL